MNNQQYQDALKQIEERLEMDDIKSKRIEALEAALSKKMDWQAQALAEQERADELEESNKMCQEEILGLQAENIKLEDSVFQYGIENTKLQTRIEELEEYAKKGPYSESQARENNSLRIRIEELEEELDNERARGIHSCGPDCQRPMCVLRRENAELEACLRDLLYEFKEIESINVIIETYPEYRAIIERLEKNND